MSEENEQVESSEETTKIADTLYDSSKDDEPAAKEEKSTKENSEESTESSETEESDESKESNDSEDEAGDSDSETDDSKSEGLELKMPENTHMKQEQLDNIASFAKENGLNQDQAQSIVQQQSEAISSFVSEAQKEHQQITEGWLKQTIADPDIGGDNLAAASEQAKRVVERFGSEEFSEMLETTRYGDHPEVVRLLSKIGKAMADDSMIFPKGKEGTRKSHEEHFYGNKT